MFDKIFGEVSLSVIILIHYSDYVDFRVAHDYML